MFQKNSTVRPIFIILRLLRTLICLVLILILAFPIGFYGMAMYIEPSLPDTRQLKEVSLQMPLQIYTADHKLIGQYGNTYSMPVHYEDLPPMLVNAFLAAEDDSYFEHRGISVKGLGRAITQMLTNDEEQTGGSTITQQVAKNYFLTPEQTFERKLTEMYLARRIENQLSKNEIMTLYVNKIYLGQGAYGIKAGARRYYNKDLDELSIAEMAMLAGLPKAPSDFNPVVNPSRALERRNWILGRMLSEGFINQSQYNEAIASDINLSMYHESVDINMPYLSEMARVALVDKYGSEVVNSGWRVVLTVDSKNQQVAEKAIIKGIEAYHHRHNSFSYIEAQEGNLANFNTYNELNPAKITQVLDNGGFEAVLNTGENIRVTRSPTRLKVDNIVRVRKNNDNWQLAPITRVQGALASINPDNGALIAVVGGYNFYQSKFNRATQGYRQPGSTIKPLIYAAALESKKYTPDSILSDTPIEIDGWTPKNADSSFRGGMSMRQALAVSRNIPVIRAYLGTGAEETHALLTNFGLEKNRLPQGAALALGATDATPLQMATAYAAFVNGGHRIQPYFIEQIYNFDNELIYQANPQQACALCFNSQLDKINAELQKNFEKNQADPNKSDDNKTTLAVDAASDTTTTTDGNDSIDKNTQPNPTHVYRLHPRSAVQYTVAEQAPRILTPATAYNMAEMLKLVVSSGTARKALELGRSDIGGKTGTTNLAKDAWFAGVHPTNAAVVWIGFDNPRSLGAGEYGGVAALPVWIDFMRSYLEGRPVQWVRAGNRSRSETQRQTIVDLTDDNPTGEPQPSKAKQTQTDTPATQEPDSQETAADSSDDYNLSLYEDNGVIPEGDGVIPEDGGE